MECKKINAEALRKMLGLDELNPTEAAKIQGGELKEICKRNCKCDDVNPGCGDIEL